MCKEPVDILAEKLITFVPIMTKKIIKFDMHSNKMLPFNQSMVLGILNDEGSISISEICKKVLISKPQMTIIIDKLVHSDLVYRVHNEGDRRTININITEKGNKYCRNILEMFKENLKTRLMSLSKEDLAKLLDSIQTTQSILKQME
jgi:DNA-binding MarR family transcriptional regulator